MTTRARRSRRPPAPPRRRTVVRRRTVASGWFPVRPRARSRATTPRARLACSAAATGVTRAPRTFSAARATLPRVFPAHVSRRGCVRTPPCRGSSQRSSTGRFATPTCPRACCCTSRNRTRPSCWWWSPRPSRTATEKRHANEANSEENDAKARFPRRLRRRRPCPRRRSRRRRSQGPPTGGSAFAGSAFANAFESDAADRRGDAGEVNAWNDGYDGEEEEHGLSAHCRDILRVIKHA